METKTRRNTKTKTRKRKAKSWRSKRRKKSGESKALFMKLNNLQKDKRYYINNSDYVLNNNDSIGLFKIKFNKLCRALYNESLI